MCYTCCIVTANPPLGRVRLRKFGDRAIGVHVTAATLAEHLGLAKTTVAQVLNGRGDRVRIRQETQQRILLAAREMGYRPNGSARAMRTGRFGCVALLQSLQLAYLPTALLLGLTTALSEQNIHLSLAETPDNVVEDASFLPKVVRELTADGLLINRLVDIPEHFVEKVHSLQTPSIWINTKQEFDAVHPDDSAGGRLAVEFLLDQGHTRIAFAGVEQQRAMHYSITDRETGYAQAMQAAGLTPQFFRVPWEIEAEDYVARSRAFLRSEAMPTAIIAYEMREAMTVLHAANQLQIRVPQDLSLVMFHWGMDPTAGLPITTVGNAIAQVGREAAYMLLKKIEQPDIDLPTLAVPVEFFVGGTCGPPHGRS